MSWPFVPQSFPHGSPAALLKPQMAPRFWCLMSSGSKKKDPRWACLIEANASHQQRMWAEVSSSAPHFLQSGLSPIKWRCLHRVLCLVRSPVTTLDCSLLRDKNLALVPRYKLLSLSGTPTCNLTHWITRHGSPTTYQCFTLPQLLYRWWHQSGIFWTYPCIAFGSTYLSVLHLYINLYYVISITFVWAFNMTANMKKQKEIWKNETCCQVLCFYKLHMMAITTCKLSTKMRVCACVCVWERGRHKGTMFGQNFILCVS
jgi:hypothetical protein